MAQLALYPKGVGATTLLVVGDYPLLRDPQGSEGEGVVILSYVAAKFLGGGILSRK